MKKANLEFEVVHIGINRQNEEEAAAVAGLLAELFGFSVKNTQGSVFAGEQIEVMKKSLRGTCGHIAVRTNDIESACEYLKAKGIEFDESSAGFDSRGNLLSIYFKHEIAGFAFHLLQKT